MTEKQYDSYAEKLANSGYTVLPTEEYLELRAQLRARERDLIALPQILSDLAKALARVEELERQVFLLMPIIEDVRVTGSDHTTYNGEGVA